MTLKYWKTFIGSSFNRPKPPPSDVINTVTLKTLSRREELVGTCSRRRSSVATAMHSFSCGGGQSAVPSIPSLTCRSRRSSCSKVIEQTSTTKGTRRPMDHSEQDDQAKLYGRKTRGPKLNPHVQLLACPTATMRFAGIGDENASYQRVFVPLRSNARVLSRLSSPRASSNLLSHSTAPSRFATNKKVKCF